MAQIGNVHPDTLVPRWHASRHLTPEETETVGRILSIEAPKEIAEYEAMFKEWLELLPPIPPRRADRAKWALSLEGSASSAYYNYEQARVRISELKEAMRSGDLRTALRLMTSASESSAEKKAAHLRPEWQRVLQGIRESLERRIDDALEGAAAAKSAELAATEA